MQNRLCYYIPSHDPGEDIHPAIVRENESGYFPTDWNWGKDMEQARIWADERNVELGLTKDDVAEIIASSMTAKSKRGRR